jgi:hypothetical protein
MTLQRLSHTAPDAQGVSSGIPPWMPPEHPHDFQPVNLHPALEDIRHMREFLPEQPSQLEKWLEQPAFKEFGQQLNKLLNHFSEELARALSGLKVPGSAKIPDFAQDLLSGFIGFIIVLSALFALYVLLGLFLKWTERAEKAPQAISSQLDELPLKSAAFHKQEAQKAAERGDYSTGIRHWYMALLCLLDETQFIPFSKTRSNLEYGVLLKARRQDLHSPFEQLATCFESLYYGNGTGNEEQFRQCGTWYTQLQKEITHRA